MIGSQLQALLDDHSLTRNSTTVIPATATLATMRREAVAVVQMSLVTKRLSGPICHCWLFGHPSEQSIKWSKWRDQLGDDAKRDYMGAGAESLWYSDAVSRNRSKRDHCCYLCMARADVATAAMEVSFLAQACCELEWRGGCEWPDSELRLPICKFKQ